MGGYTYSTQSAHGKTNGTNILTKHVPLFCAMIASGLKLLLDSSLLLRKIHISAQHLLHKVTPLQCVRADATSYAR